MDLIKDRKSKRIDPVFTISKDFIIGVPLGQGAFANVVRAIHKETQYSVALKTYEKKLLTHRSQLMAVHREIYILAGLKHQNIMNLYEVIDNPTKCHLVMELCHGCNLYQYIRKKPNRRISEE